MKRLITIALFALSVVTFASAQTATTDTNAPPEQAQNLWDFVTTGSNYWAAPFGTYSVGDSTFGGGIALGYRASEIINPVVRIENFASKWWNVGLTANLQPPRTLLGKFPITPFGIAGIATPFSGGGEENGELVTIVGGGAALRLDFVGSGWFWQHGWLGVDYEKWLGLPTAKEDQLRFAFGFRF